MHLEESQQGRVGVKATRRYGPWGGHGFYLSKVGTVTGLQQRKDMIYTRFNRISLASLAAASVLEPCRLAWLCPMPGHHVSGCSALLQWCECFFSALSNLLTVSYVCLLSNQREAAEMEEMKFEFQQTLLRAHFESHMGLVAPALDNVVRPPYQEPRALSKKGVEPGALGASSTCKTSELQGWEDLHESQYLAPGWGLGTGWVQGLLHR